MGTAVRHRSRYFKVLSGSFLLTLASCVTVNLGGKDRKMAELVEIAPPHSPFTEYKTRDADRAWQNPQNGNSISYQSTCNEPSDPALQTMQQSILQGLEGAKLQSETPIQFNGREAIDTIATGSVDGVPVRIRFLVFKKNNCNYALNYVALAKTFDADSKTYESFMKGFKAP